MRNRSVQYGRQNIHVELNVTYRCNLKCRWCNRLKDEVDIPDSDMTPEQAERWCQRLATSPFRGKRVKVSGGEPRCNPQLRQILDVLVSHQPEVIGDVGVCSNATRSESMPVLPKDIGWRRSPPAKKLASGSMHIPPLMSPKDLLLQSRIPYEKCSTIKHCGAACDAWGFTACALLPMIGRALGVNPYSAEPTRTPIPELCDHCMFALCWDVREGIRHSVEVGTIRYPTPSYVKFREKFEEAKAWPKLI